MGILALHVLVNITARFVRNGRNRGTVYATENSQVFRTFKNRTTRVAVILRLVANRLARTVNRAVGSLHDHLGLAVAIVIKHLELRVVCARANILTEVNTPKARTVELVGIDEYRTRIARLRVVVSVRRIPLQNQFVFAVAVEVALPITNV